jgi:hypothetical protein
LQGMVRHCQEGGCLPATLFFSQSFAQGSSACSSSSFVTLGSVANTLRK